MWASSLGSRSRIYWKVFPEEWTLQPQILHWGIRCFVTKHADGVHFGKTWHSEMHFVTQLVVVKVILNFFSSLRYSSSVELDHMD